MLNDIKIPVTVGNVTFKNPFYVASGPTTKSVRQLVRIEETGWAAASIKLSIDPAPYINRKPRYGIFEDRKALAFTAEKRLTFEQGLKLIEEAKPKLHDLKLMANMTYAGDLGVEGWVNMARRFEEAGADIIELNMCCPNMSYNLELTSGKTDCCAKRTGASMGQDADIASEITAAVKESIHIPLFVKLTPEGGRIAQVSKAVLEAGADAVGGTGNRLGMPPVNLDDPRKAFYHLQDEISMSCHCGEWLKPLAERDVYEIRKLCGMEVPVTAAGGICNWKDAVEMILCGGTLLGVCAETLISGYDIVRPMIQGLDQYMKKHHYTDLGQMRGLVVPEVKTASDVTIYEGYAKIREPNLSAPCKSACPLHLPVQAYVQKIAKSEYREAYDLITENQVLQNLCALVCDHPCEDACIRGSFDAPVKMKELKRFVLDYGKRQGWKPKWRDHASNGHSIAVIGAGPAGLSASMWLKKAGYEVTVFEKEKTAGGSLRYGMPNYGMDKRVIEDTVNELKEAGIHFQFEKAFDRDSASEALKKDGFDKVFWAAGDSERQESQIPGAKKAEDALEFLYALNTGAKTGLEKKEAETVVVAGTGYEAFDAARSAVRLGAKSVTLLYAKEIGRRRGMKETLRLAEEEGVKVLDNSSISSVKDGFVMFSSKGILMKTACDHVILVNDNSSQGNVITAIASGKNGAAAIDRAIMGEDAVLEAVAPVKTINVEMVKKRVGYLKRDMGVLNLIESSEKRVEGFEPYTRVMTEEEAVKEASRCLNCGCGEGCQLCKTICSDFAPEIIAPDKMHIRSEECVACGMCFSRCPNGNIEMVKK